MLVDWVERLLHRVYGTRKEALFGPLRGRVLDIGAGTGVNRRYLGPGVEWVPLEPEPRMHRFLRAKDPAATILTARAEEIPLPDASVDAVIGSLVLCSVDDPARVLGEIRRVLKPQGVFAFVEHVAAPPGSRERWWQDRVQPVWSRVCGGCCPNRETLASVGAAGFVGESERFRVRLPIVAPHVAGRFAR